MTPYAYRTHYAPVMGSTDTEAAAAFGGAMDAVFVVALVTSIHGQVVQLVESGMTIEEAQANVLTGLADAVAAGEISEADVPLWTAVVEALYAEIGYAGLSAYIAAPDPATTARIAAIFMEVEDAAATPPPKERSPLSTALLLIAGAITAYALVNG